MSAPPARELPVLTELNREFWTAGASGELRFQRCQACGWWCHPPRPMCPHCHGRDLAMEPVSGDATVFSFTVNHQPWKPDLPVPYVIALVELPEQPGLRLTTNVVGCEVGDVSIGMPVLVHFEQQGEIFIPLFGPRSVPDR